MPTPLGFTLHLRASTLGLDTNSLLSTCLAPSIYFGFHGQQGVVKRQPPATNTSQLMPQTLLHSRKGNEARPVSIETITEFVEKAKSINVFEGDQKHNSRIQAA